MAEGESKEATILSISIVSYNTRETTAKAIKALESSLDSVDSEIIVVDNGSTDGSIEEIKELFTSIRIISNSRNRYFTAAHNQAFDASNGRYFLIMNSDIIPNPAAIMGMLSTMDSDNTIGAVGCRVIHEGAKRKTAWHQQKPFDLLSSLYPIAFVLANKRGGNIGFSNGSVGSNPVEVVSDSFLMIRRSAIGEYGRLYDESMRLYFTEDDLCTRIRTHGLVISYRDDLSVRHLSGQSVKKLSKCKIARIYISDMWNYATKYFGLLRSTMLIAPMILHFIWVCLSSLRFHLVSRRDN